MEGVVLVEMASGALHYTKSFTDRFDVHHPKSERLNLGALIFALQNFAGSSTQGKYENEGSGAATGLQASRSAEIAMYSTPLENVVMVTTPSNKLLVVRFSGAGMIFLMRRFLTLLFGDKGLFTTPEFDAVVAKWIARRLAFNYESCDSTCTEMELTTALNQVSRRFRLAFHQSVDDVVEIELIHFSETILIPLEGELEAGGSKPDGDELFLFFYYSSRLDRPALEGGNDLITGKAGSTDDCEEKYRNAVRTANPTLSDILQHSAKQFSIRNIVASTRAIITSCESTSKKKAIRWRSRNAVVNHSAPQEFQRVIEICTHERKAALMEPHRTGTAYGIADVLLPFVGLSSDWTTRPNNTLDKLRSQNFNQIVWKNIPGASLVNGKRQGTNIIAWRSGPCCIFYPVTASSTDPESIPRVRHAVSALFNVLVPLLKAKAIV